MGAAASAPPSTSAPPKSRARSRRSSHAFAEAHQLGMVTVLWCYLRNTGVQEGRRRLPASSADLTGQANHLGVTIEADIIKQKLPENNGGYNALKGSARPHKCLLPN